MSRRKKTDPGIGEVDGGEGRGVPLGGHDDRPPTGYNNTKDEVEWDDRDFDFEDGDIADRRRDPLRQP